MKSKDIVVGGTYIGEDGLTTRVVNSIMDSTHQVYYSAYRVGAMYQVGCCYISNFASWAKERVDDTASAAEMKRRRKNA